jgi:predicted restriction endonuclease
MNRADYWLAKLSKLRVDRARGDAAPHKPLLLLVLCDLAESGDLRDVLPLSPELAFRFHTYWSIVAGRRSQRPDIRLPFHHLAGDGIWSAVDERGETSPDKKFTKAARLSSDKDEVYDFSPMLSGRLVADSKDGIETVVRQLLDAMD